MDQSKSLEPVALSSKHLKIGDDNDRLKSCIRLQMLKVGIRANNLPNDEEKDVLIDFVKRNFGQFSVNQISEAFELAITGELPIKDAGCYENFSCEYFGRIMAGYKAYLINTGRVQKNIDIERKAIANNDLPLLENRNANWEPHILELKDKIKKGQIPEIIPTSIYDWLEKKNLIKFDFTTFLTDAKKIVLTKLKEEKRTAQMNGKNINSILADLESLAKNDNHQKIIIQAKRMAIAEYLKS